MSAASVTDPSAPAGQIASLLGLLNSATPDDFAEAADAVQAGLKDQATKDALREAGALPMLVAPLKDGSDSLTTASAVGALQNATRGNPLNKVAVRELHAIPSLVGMVSASPLSDAALEAVETLLELACEDAKNAQAIVNAKGVEAVGDLLLVAPMASRAKKLAMETLLHVARGSEISGAEVGAARGLPLALLDVLSAKPSPYAKILALDLIARLASVPANRRTLAEAMPIGPLLDAWDAATVHRPRQLFEAAKASEALEGLGHAAAASLLGGAGGGGPAAAGDEDGSEETLSKAEDSAMAARLAGAMARRGSTGRRSSAFVSSGALGGGTEGLTTAEQGLVSAVILLIKRGSDVPRLQAMLGPDLYLRLKSAAERALDAAMRLGDVGVVHGTYPLGQTLEVSGSTLERAGEFLGARPEEVAILDEKGSEIDDARRKEGKRGGRRGSIKGAAMIAGAGASGGGGSNAPRRPSMKMQ